MKQREVRDQENLVWQCVQPLTGNATVEKASVEKLAGEHGSIRVVCTPSKAAQSVEIHVPLDWMEAISDEDILKRIQENKTKPDQQ